MKHSWKRNSSPSTLFISPHLNIPHNTFSNRQNCNYIIAKRNSSSYNKFFTSLTGKNPPFPLTFLNLYKNQQNLWVPPLDSWLLGSPNCFVFCEWSWFIRTLHFKPRLRFTTLCKKDQPGNRQTPEARDRVLNDYAL